MIQKNKNKKNQFILLIFLYLILPFIKSFTYFKAFPLLSNDIVLITDEGISKFEISTGRVNEIMTSNLILLNLL